MFSVYLYSVGVSAKLFCYSCWQVFNNLFMSNDHSHKNIKCHKICHKTESGKDTWAPLQFLIQISEPQSVSITEYNSDLNFRSPPISMSMKRNNAKRTI